MESNPKPIVINSKIFIQTVYFLLSFYYCQKQDVHFNSIKINKLNCTFFFFFLDFILITVAASYADGPCTVYMVNSCAYTVTCTNNVDSNLDWSRFTNRHLSSMFNEETCQNTIAYGSYRVYPVTLVYKQTFNDASLVPKFSNNWGVGNFLNIVQKLDLSDDSYSETPVIRSMQNLVSLNMSRNQLTTAVLSNEHELIMLSEVDLSHNTISNIEVNPNSYPYKKLKNLNLSHNYLVKIPDAIFDAFDYLQILDLSHNFIDMLTQFTFEGVKQLTDLNLSYNRLAGINSSLFRFIELKILNLKGNRIKDVKLTDFEHLRNLATLDLSSNNIKSINYNLLNTMSSLQNLYLSENQLEVVNKNAFSNLLLLTSIDLSKNKFKSLPKGLFKNNTILNFSIEENRLEGPLEKGMFEGINVTKLDLSNQFLTEVKDYAFNELSRLDTLLLNSNNIQSLSTMCFKSLINLQNLDLSNNQICNIDFNKEDLHNLHSLLLKNNHIIQVNHEQLQHLNNLEFLDLSDNEISRLEPRSFLSLENLINLRINSNPLMGTLETGSFDGMVLLPSLDISNNMLTTIQNASFNHMYQLKELNISHCAISELQFNAFVHTGYIEMLDLSYNKLESFFVNTTELSGIYVLYLNNNFIKSISASSLYDLPRLNKITLSHNNIEKMDKESFNSLHDLRHLDLSYNEKLLFMAAMLEKNKHLNTLILSGIRTNINFTHIIDDSPLSTLQILSAGIKNISTLNLAKVAHLDSLDLSFNNVSELRIGDFTGVTTLRFLDLSYNNIKYIQPGVFKDSTVLHYLNISHNSLSAIDYGIFRGLIYLSILDISYNTIKDLESERFYEVKSLSELIADNNKIDVLNAEEFLGTSLSKLSIGDNPLPCQVLVKLKRHGVPFEITAIRIDEHSNENVNGVTCNKGQQSSTTLPKNVSDHNETLDGLRNILYNLTNRDADRQNIEYLEKISNILETSKSIYDDKLSRLSNLTYEFISVNNNTNNLIGKIVDILLHNSTNNALTSIAPDNKSFVPTTTHVPLIRNNTDANNTVNIISYINKIKNELEDAMTIQKQNIMDEVEAKLSQKNYPHETVATNIGHEQLVSNNDNGNTKSYFTEICVALILLILVGLVLYKFYKSRMFIRNRFSYSTRELPGSMENSAL